MHEAVFGHAISAQSQFEICQVLTLEPYADVSVLKRGILLSDKFEDIRQVVGGVYHMFLLL